jgi:cell division protease FtsH
LLENETLNKEEIAAVFKKVRKVKPRAAWTGSQKRIPSNQPPVALKPAKVKQNFEEKPDLKQKNTTKKKLSAEGTE